MTNVYVDSCLIITLIEGSAYEQELLRKYLFQHLIYSSELTRLETRILAIRSNDRDNLKRFEIFFAGCKMVDLDRAVFEKATLLRSQSKLKTPDALHLAAATQSNCQEFWTDDRQLKAIASQHLKVIDWAVLAEQEGSEGITNEE